MFEKKKGFLKKNPKGTFCFKLCEIFTIIDPFVVDVNEKLPFRSKDISK
jgi:hypothetical protein